MRIERGLAVQLSLPTTILLWYSTILLTVLVSLSLLLFTVLTEVPTLSSSKAEVNDVIALIRCAGLPGRAVIIDLGSGRGTLVTALARAFPEASVAGVEISLFPYLISRLRTHSLSNVSLRWGNMFRADLRCADAVVCYLMPASMSRVGELLDRDLSPGTCVVSNTFLFRGRMVSAVHRGVLRGTVALYTWPARHPVAGDSEKTTGRSAGKSRCAIPRCSASISTCRNKLGLSPEAVRRSTERLDVPHSFNTDGVHVNDRS